MKQLHLILLTLCVLILSASVNAHEIRPAYLEITEQAGGNVEIRWRQPVTGEYSLALAPVLSSGWLDVEPQQIYITSNSLIKTWTVHSPAEPLAGQSLWIRGLDRTITDVLVRVQFPDGRILKQLIKASRPSMQIPAEKTARATLPEYLQLGVSHIWSGPDHLVYVLGLVLLISSLRSLVTTITAFTLAHSITLALATLGLVHLRPAPVEAVISLSIICVAVELQRQHCGRTGLASRSPWLIAFVFGLLHGFGFAGALLEAGLPENSIAPALFLFNVGIEIGQFLFLLLVVTILRILKNTVPVWRHQIIKAAPYGIGSMASFWLLERLAVIL